jgi:glycosyltransferase involved in cell wall biosynthesis
MVFYQSHELLERAADLLGIFPRQLSPDRHIVLPRGIPEPPTLAKTQIRDRIRAKLEIKTHEVVILYIGRISRQKGLLELLEALNLATFRDLKLRGVLVGSQPGFDETALIEKKLHEIPKLNERVMLLPACNPDEVWEYLCAADIFAFPSHKEGMPNSLLEAMAMGVPTIAFAIPPIVEVEAETGALTLVPPLDPARFAEAILRLVACPDERRWTGEKGRMVVKDRFMVRKNMAEALHRLELLVTERRGGANKQIAIL